MMPLRYRLRGHGACQTCDVGDDWYRGPGWSQAEQDEFERRLARARSWNRSQYLYIKADGLMKAGHRDAAVGLLQRGLDVDEDGFATPGLLESLAEAVRPEDSAYAERLLRRLLAEYPDLNATTEMAEVSLAEILISTGTESALVEAYRLLHSWTVKRAPFLPANSYRHCLALIRLAEALGDHCFATRMAGQAMSLVDQPGPFGYHPTVGRVRATEGELRWLAQLASYAEIDRRTDASPDADGCGRMDALASDLATDESYQQELAAWTAEDDVCDAAPRRDEEPVLDHWRTN